MITSLYSTQNHTAILVWKLVVEITDIVHYKYNQFQAKHSNLKSRNPQTNDLMHIEREPLPKRIGFQL